MRKNILLARAILFFLFVFAGPLFMQLQAQNTPTSCRVYCPDGTSHLVNCNTTIDPCTGGTLDPNRIQGTGGVKLTSPFGNGMMGFMLGGLGGSLFKDSYGNNQWLTGATAGYSFFSLLTFITVHKKRSVGANMILGALTGGTGTYAAIKIAEMNKKQPTGTTPVKEPDPPILETGIGAVVVATTAALMTGKSKGHLAGSLHRIGRSNLLSKLSFNMTGDRIGIVVRL